MPGENERHGHVPPHYFTTKVHFGGHVVAMYGYDDQDALFRNLNRDFLAECAELIAPAGESGDARNLVRAGSLLHETARIERETMRALSRL
ncbi:hypothetical protein [Streptomyces griseosporeus]